MGNSLSSGQEVGLGAGLGAIVTLIVVGSSFYFLQKNGAPSIPGMSGLKVLPVLLSNLLPISFFLYGFISDMLKTELNSSIPSIISLGFMFLFKLFDYFVAGTSQLPGGSSVNETGVWCTLPGFEFLENPFIPTSLFTFTFIIFYYAMMAFKKFGNTWLTSSLWIGGAIGSSAIMSTHALNGCINYYAKSYSPLISLVLGTGLGSAFGYFIGANPFNSTSNTGGSSGGSSSSNSSVGSCGAGEQKTYDGLNCVKCPPQCTLVGLDCKCDNPADEPPQPNPPQPVPGTHGLNSTHSLPVSGSEQTFVAELYKDGQLVMSK